MSRCGAENDCATPGVCTTAQAVPATAIIRPLPRDRSLSGEPLATRLLIGLDVGSTTVKAVVIDAARDEILWRDYQRHETRQAEKAAAFLEAIEAAFPDVPRGAMRLFITGSGGAALIRHVGGKFVQEVNAVSLAVEKLHPEVMSVVELGGQDAKIIVFKAAGDGSKKKIPSMNDKCAGGTGAVIDKINAKLGIAPERLCEMGYRGITLHPVAGKCGVFAETDINSLQQQGVPPEELMASLFEAIVQQNLSVLTRGHTLQPTVLLLGGPNTYIKGLRECWQRNIATLWAERGVTPPDPARPPADYVVMPDNAQYYAAIGAVEFGRQELQDVNGMGRYFGVDGLERYLEHDLLAAKEAAGARALAQSPEELAAFVAAYRPPAWEPARFTRGATVQVFIGIDGGSTSTKGVLLGTDRLVLAKAYLLSRGNPIADTQEVIACLARHVTDQGAQLEVLGVGTTGYAKDVLRDVLKADVALVETVAHTQACLHFYPDTDVIVDVGGQDIKLMILRDGRVKDFKLNTQCSAGNGYFLQATARSFGIAVDDYAEVAFSARSMPEFGYGCAVFMQSDIVDFQRQGWQPNEILAGLAAVLPKNIWLYVAQVPNLAVLGSRFVLQGGTQRNLAAVKAQVDFIRSRYHGTRRDPEITVHQHCGESGAIGCAIEAQRLWAEHGRVTSFIGCERVSQIRYRTTHNEDTRCHFCKNECVRTFIDVYTGDVPGHTSAAQDRTPGSADVQGGTSVATADTSAAGTKDSLAVEASAPASVAPIKPKLRSRVPLASGYQRLIISTCEKGAVEDLADMRRIKAGLDEVMDKNPNFLELASRMLFRETRVENVADTDPGMDLLGRLTKRAGKRRRLMARRTQLRIGVPRVLNVYSYAPFLIGYFTALGVPYRNLVFSDYTDPELYKRGARRGSIDPCFPSKLAIPHLHDLIYHHHGKRPLTHIFFPMADTLPTYLAGVWHSYACPTIVATVEAAHAAFIKEGDLLRQRGITFKKTFLNLDEPRLCARQMYEDWKDELGVSPAESERAVRQGLAAMEHCYAELRAGARRVLDQLERENRIGVVVLARPYHNDPGINHDIPEQLQKRGYPIFWQDALPLDGDVLERLFGDEIRAGVIDSAFSIDDVWKNSFSEHTSRKVWAAKYVARHPNLVALELSSFKCGLDAPVYTVIQEIVESSGTPYFCFKDIDENRPAGSIKIRIETIAYFLSRYGEHLGAAQAQRAEIERYLEAFEVRLGNRPAKTVATGMRNRGWNPGQRLGGRTRASR